MGVPVSRQEPIPRADPRPQRLSRSPCAVSAEEGSILSGLCVPFLESGKDLELGLKHTPGPKELGK